MSKYKKEYYFIGNYTNNGVQQIKINNKTTNIVSETKDYINCSYLYKRKKYIYSVIEILQDKEYKGGYVVAYKENNGNLEQISIKKTEGAGPCFLSMDKKRNILYVTNYTDGSLIAFLINKDGSIGEKIFQKEYKKGISHLHCLAFYKKYKYIFLNDLGQDKLYVYEIKYQYPKLELIKKDEYQFQKGTEPRHILIVKNDIYVITEKTCKLYVMQFDEKNGLIKKDCVSLLGKDNIITKKDTGCAIKARKNNKYVYTSVRGKNQISVFKNKKGKLYLHQEIKCEGDIPRDIELNRKETEILVANQESNSITRFKINKKTGYIKFKDLHAIQNPSCIIKK